MRRGVAVLWLAVLFPLAAPAQVTQAWVRRYDNGQTNGERPSDIAIDGAGNVYVTGHSQSAAGHDDYVTIKYSTDGVELWRDRHDESGNSDWASALALDASGNVFVTGTTQPGNNADYLTIKYDAAGNRLWTARHDRASRQDGASAIALDAAGSVYITGTSASGNSREWDTIKYDANGNVVWVAHFGNGGDPAAIAVDASGSVVVTGQRATVKYDPNGSELWASPFNNAGGSALALDAAGNAYVAGYISDGAGGTDYLTIKYNPAGSVLWQRRWNAGRADGAEAIGLVQNYVYVTGAAGNYTGTPLRTAVTLQYAVDGTLRWARGLDPWRGGAYALATDVAANVYVTGAISAQNYGDDFATAKYSRNGDLRWTVRYHFVQSDGPGVGIGVDAAGGVYVTGQSEGPDMPNGSDQDDYATIKYVETGFSLGAWCWPWREDPFGRRRWHDILRCLALPILIVLPVILFTAMFIRQRRNPRRVSAA